MGERGNSPRSPVEIKERLKHNLAYGSAQPVTRNALTCKGQAGAFSGRVGPINDLLCAIKTDT